VSYGNVGTTEWPDLKNTACIAPPQAKIYRYLRCSPLNCVTITCTSGDLSNSGLAAAILDLSLTVRSNSIAGITVELLDPENMGLAFGITLLSCVQLEFPHEEVVTLITNENGTPSDFSPIVPVVS